VIELELNFVLVLKDNMGSCYVIFYKIIIIFCFDVFLLVFANRFVVCIDSVVPAINEKINPYQLGGDVHRIYLFRFVIFDKTFKLYYNNDTTNLTPSKLLT